MSRILLIGLLVAVIATGAVWMWFANDSSFNRAHDSLSANDGDKVAELEKELGQVKNEMRRVSLQSIVTAQPSDRMTVSPAPSDPDQGEESGDTIESPEDPEIAMERGRQMIVEKFDRLSNLIQQEQRDPNWAESAETVIDEVVKQLQESGMTGATVLDSECRSTMCKVDIAYDNPQLQAQMSDRIRSPFFAGGEVRRYEADGELRSTSFYYREGYERPM